MNIPVDSIELISSDIPGPNLECDCLCIDQNIVGYWYKKTILENVNIDIELI